MAVVHNAKEKGEFDAFPEIIELNVGGQVYITRYPTLVSVQGSLLWEMFSQKNPLSLSHDNKGRFFVDRDGFLFRYVLDYMRDHQLVLPDHFPERSRLKREAEYFKLPDLVKILAPDAGNNSVADELRASDSEEPHPIPASGLSVSASGPGDSPVTTRPGAGAARKSGYITLGYRGSYTLGRDSQTDAKFRRVARIMVCGKISLAKEVFGETLNESRDPDRPPERYTSRYYLKFNYLEQAFDKLATAGFHMVTSNSTGTCACAQDQADDKIWTSYTEYIFYRSPLAVEEQGVDPASSCPPESKLQKVSRDSKEEVPKFKTIWEPKPHPADDLSVGVVSGTHRFTVSIHEPSHRDVACVASLANIDSVEDQASQDPRRPEPQLSVPFVWPEQGPCPSRPESNNYCQPFKRVRKVKQSTQRWNSEDSSVPETVLDDESDRDQVSEERRRMAMELDKCIEEFRKIKIPCTFPNKKRPWQSELLQKYHV
ncbi:BTB/POZ domain-containing protein KCTD12-like isoform X2 [Antechinus flavipes]|uniref:BTB/POZ domain-containing protein KCTD12-like isoform X2 n=1 Tax=Antechinus flavipes TaxID=38775 RepID=UPI0022366E4F|nr:BTB/POZ domain-containing protein KCTD12-like isoform X2 [Antechinus flavipes]